jgi:septal ring factor EnvC (AmiA/AmiB activator)
MIVADVTPAVAGRRRPLRAQLEELATLRAVQEAGLTQLSDGLAGAQAARSALSQAIADRRTLPQPLSLDADAMQAILESALSLDDFASVPSRTAKHARRTISPICGSAGYVATPGRRYRAPTVRGGRCGRRRAGRGWSSRPARTLVTTPWPASVRYAGPLLDYGNVIILEPEADYLLIVAGLATLFVQAGDC